MNKKKQFSFSFTNLSKDQTNIIKGIAMICLVLHNFLHWTNEIGENEMIFDANRIFVLFETIKNIKTMLFNGLFSYFGFYVLELFIFISGYGLAKQYSKNTSICYKNYLLPRLVKLYALLIFGITIYFVVFYRYFDLKWFSSFAISSLLMYNNFSFDRIFSFIGPWWYFSLTFQLYLIFPFLYKLLNKYQEKGFFVLIILSSVLIFVLQPLAAKFNFPIFGNFFGHLPEFILGIGFAMFPKFKINWKIAAVSLLVFILANFSTCFFPFSFLSATVLLLLALYPFINYSPVWLSRLLVFLGRISVFMFLINGPLRTFTMPLIIGKHPLVIFGGAFIHLLIVIIVSYFMSLLYKKIISPLVTKLIKRMN